MDYFVLAEGRIQTVSGRAIESCGDLLRLFGYNSLSYCVYTLPSVSLWDGIKTPSDSEFKPIPQENLLHEIHTSSVIFITKNKNLNQRGTDQRKDRLRKRTHVTKETHTSNVIVISSDSDNDCQDVAAVSNRLCSRVQLNPEDMATLQSRQWLNDQVINSYMNLLMDHCKVKLVDYLYILIPVNLNNSHWTLCCVDLRKREITYYDSMGGKDISIVKRILKFLTTYFKLNIRDKKLAPNKMRVNFKKHPKQRNDYDCGVFICQYARWVCESTLADSSSKLTSSIPSKRTRQKMIIELHNQFLM